MNIEIGSKYIVDNETVEVLAYSNGIMMVKENDDNLMFILGGRITNNNGVHAIDSNNKISYTITETEMLSCINSYLMTNEEEATVETIVKAVRNTYYKIPTPIANVIAEWYMR